MEGIHSCLCGILSDAVEAGYITHNPAWRAYKKKGISKERPVADEETVQRLIAALETQSFKYEVYYKLILATGKLAACAGLTATGVSGRCTSEET